MNTKTTVLVTATEVPGHIAPGYSIPVEAIRSLTPSETVKLLDMLDQCGIRNGRTSTGFTALSIPIGSQMLAEKLGFPVGTFIASNECLTIYDISVQIKE